MDRTTIASLYADEPTDTSITVAGWVRSVRDMKNFGFIELNDGSYFRNLQVVCNDTLPNFEDITHITTGSAVTVEGKLVLTPDMKQPFEVHAEEVVVEAQDLNAQTLKFRLAGLPARIVQHEIDHLDGKLIVDRTSPDERRRVMKELREQSLATGT